MTTNKPVELGRVTEETKHKGPEFPDHEGALTGDVPL
jgi:hypothetical protein